MKKIFVIALTFIFSLSFQCAYGSNVMTFDDVVLGKTYVIEGYAMVTLLDFSFINMYAQWDNGQAGPNKSNSAKFYVSGNEADIAWLKIDILNLQKSSVDFAKNITVKVIYDDEYEYDGWVRQFYYDYANNKVNREEKDTGIIGWPICLSPADGISIGPLYNGHYVLGCKLPNTVIEETNAPLRMIINIEGHKLTYNIRN